MRDRISRAVLVVGVITAAFVTIVRARPPRASLLSAGLGAVSVGIAELLVEALQVIALVVVNLLLARPARRRGRMATRLRVAHLLLTLSWLMYVVASAAWSVRMDPEALPDLAASAARWQPGSIHRVIEAAFVGAQAFFASCVIAVALGNPAGDAPPPAAPQ